MDTRFIDELAARLGAALPQGAQALRQDIEKNMRAVLQASFSKLDLVTREEFEIQSQVLARTRARLETLEQRVAALEAERDGE